jgi:AcrR family transcriptional regulator
MSATEPVASPGERPLRKDAARNRERILDAAAEVFAERGLHVTLDDIARHAGVGVGTVYRRFADKDALIDALFDERLAQFSQLAEEALANPSPFAGLELFLSSALEQQAADRGLRELVFAGDRGSERVARAREQVFPLVDRLIRNAHAAGELRTDVSSGDVGFLQKMLVAVMDLTERVEPELWRRYLGILLDGLRPAREAPTPLAVPALDPDAWDRCIHAAPGARTRG